MHTEMEVPFASLFESDTFYMILVTGATGFIGRHLVKKLLEDGIPIYALTRKDDLLLPKDKKLTKIKGDINRLTEFPQDVTCIYNCAGVISREEQMVETNVNGTKNIADIALKKGCRLIHLSSAGVVGKCKSDYIDEKTECNPQSLYERSKWEAEKILIDYVAKGLKVQVLRPTIVFGTDKDYTKDSFLQLVSAIKSGRYVNIAGGKGIYNIVHVDEVVRALCSLNNDKILNGQIFFVNSPITFNDFSKIVKKETANSSDKILSVPYVFAFLVALVFVTIEKATGRRAIMNFDRLKALTNMKIFSQRLIVDTTDYRPMRSVEDYIRRTCQEYWKLGLLN
ncbi:MAG TPA: NAD-dependent epimerase/dehydratase family protein [Syntrophorhabdaceae bacterium]|nr:NAD-dependent epimerase/dehydratase family protein [Syntrophorhabdaceae bacterium]HPL40312.1 NAD-dependent epimerase/dehydratase family protein [Syntrophorhabdaceae bacterium]HQM75848.1 NAD-dependent epimerase/dehydratase family protein [Syntrophorhabdaceae bacterium]